MSPGAVPFQSDTRPGFRSPPRNTSGIPDLIVFLDARGERDDKGDRDEWRLF